MKLGGRNRFGFACRRMFDGLCAFGKDTSKTIWPPGFAATLAISATARATKRLPMCRKTALVTAMSTLLVLERQIVRGDADRVEPPRRQRTVAVLDETLEHRLGNVDRAIGRPGYARARARDTTESARSPRRSRAPSRSRRPCGKRCQTGAILPVSVAVVDPLGLTAGDRGTNVILGRLVLPAAPVV